MGSSWPFSLKEDPVRCAKVCDKSWVILPHLRERGALMLIQDHFGIIQNLHMSKPVSQLGTFLAYYSKSALESIWHKSFRTFRGPLNHKPVTLQVTFLDTWCNLLALPEVFYLQRKHKQRQKKKCSHWVIQKLHYIFE